MLYASALNIPKLIRFRYIQSTFFNPEGEMYERLKKFRYIYAISAYGFLMKVYQWDTLEEKMRPMLPRQPRRNKTDDIPYKEDWKYHLLSHDGHNILMATFKSTYD